MIKIKQSVNYRQARVAKDGKDRNCGNCINSKTITIHNCSTGDPIKEGLRCLLIGLGESRKYAITNKHICDRFEIGG